MQPKHKFVGLGTLVVFLFVFSISQLQAQSTITLQSLSERIDKAFQSIWELERQGNTTTSSLEIRVSRLETRVARSSATATRRPSTPTRRPATATPTKIRATDTPVPVVPFVTISRPMNLRQGPDTIYAIVRVAEVGERFDITGRNSNGTWWRIDVEGENAWVYAAYVTATNADRIRSVPTPLPPRPTPQPTATSRPQTSQNSSGEEAYAYAAALVFFDQMSMGTLDEWTNSPDSQKNRAVQISASLLTQLTRWCGLSTEEMADLVGEYGKVLDNTGYTARTGLPVRQLLMYFMSEFAEENPSRTASCEELFEVGAMSLLESE